jgi:hypothetical protein
VKDWLLSFLAAASLIGLTLWCAKIFVTMVWG